MWGFLCAQRKGSVKQLDLMRQLNRTSSSKIILLILDGLGGIPMEPGGQTALEAAATPNLDRLARQGATGQAIPIRRGITPGSGPAHLALFGYEPLDFDVGRGVLEATGVGMEVAIGDVAARGNLCTLDQDGRITDRRAGRIPSDQARPLINRLAQIEMPKVSFEVRHVREYRFALVARGANLIADLTDTDPQQVGLAPLRVTSENPESELAAEAFNAWVAEAHTLLSDHATANGLTLRGFSTNPQLPGFSELYGLSAGCVAVYPMYRGVSKLVGMQIIKFEGESAQEQFDAASLAIPEHDFLFIHIKATDSRGEDGDIEGKAAVIERVDHAIPSLLELNPAVLAVTGDHSTPARMRSHSWHPVPFLLSAPETMRPDTSSAFAETVCQSGGLGTFQATDIMPLLMAHAGRLHKYGA
jgi:2,3-bisphosphoglycerate-independent phosphoglycerate mutase